MRSRGGLKSNNATLPEDIAHARYKCNHQGNISPIIEN